MKRTTNQILLLIVMLLTQMSVRAAVVNVTYEGMNFNIHTTADYGARGDGEKLSGAVLINTNSKTGTITIPSHVPYNGTNYPVVGVSGNESTFYYRSGIKKIVIPGTVRCMENNSLRQVFDLEELVFEDGTEDLWMGYAPGYFVDDELTYGSDKLNKVTLGRNMLWHTDEDEPFESKYNLKTIIITPGCTKIGCPGTNVTNRRLFNCCTGVETIRIEDSDTPLYVEYCGLYMKSSSSARHQWKNIYVGRNVQYPGWNNNDNSANADGYSPFYKLGNSSSVVTIGPKVTRLSSYLLYNSYVTKINCQAESVCINNGAFSKIEISGRMNFKNVVLDQSNYDEPAVITNADIGTFTIKSACASISTSLYHLYFDDSYVENFIIESSANKLVIGKSGFQGLTIGRLYCNRDIEGTFSGTERYHYTVNQEIVLSGQCTSVGNIFQDVALGESVVIRIGKSVRQLSGSSFSVFMPYIAYPHFDDEYTTMEQKRQLIEPVINAIKLPTIIFEAESIEELPEIKPEKLLWDGELYGFYRNVKEYPDLYTNVPVFLNCRIDPTQLPTKWNCKNLQKWHPQTGNTKGSKNTSTGLYAVTCAGGCGNVTDSKSWIVDRWDGEHDLMINAVKGKTYYTYNGNIQVDDSKPFQIPVTINPTGIEYNRNVTAGNVETLILPFKLAHASCINGMVYKFREYANGKFCFDQLADDAPLLAGTPYIVVPSANTTKLIGTMDIENSILATVNANGTAKEFSLSNGNAAQFGVFASKQVQSSGTDTYYIYSTTEKHYVKATSAATINPFRTYFKMTGNDLPQSVSILLTDVQGNTELLGGMFTITSANVEGNTGETKDKVFDGNAASKWCGTMPTNASPLTLEFKSATPVCLTSYHFYTGNDINYGGNNRNPNAWKLSAKLGENDDWEVISNVEDGYLPTSVTTKSEDYAIAPEYLFKKYSFFKFEFTGVVKGKEFEIGEICLNTNSIDIDNITAQGEEATADGNKRSGRVATVAPVTVNGVTYTLYKDYYYVPVEGGVAQTELKRGVDGLSCVLTACEAEGSLNIPSTVDFVIGGNTVSVPVVALGEGMLGYGSNKVTSLTIPSTVVVAEKFALEDRTSEQQPEVSKLTSVRFENSEHTLFMHRGNGENGALGLDASLQEVYISRVIEGSNPAKSVFAGSQAANLSVTFGDAVSVIPANMFKNVAALKNVQLPSSLKAVPKSMCEGCTGLTTIEIPRYVTAIGKNAFAGCSNMTTYTLLPTTAPDVCQEEGTLCGTDDYQIIIPEGTVGAYLYEGNWQPYKNHIVKPELKDGLYHPAAEATFSSVGYTRECWEDLATGKLYADPYFTMELDPVFAIVYPKYGQTLVKETSANMTSYESKVYEDRTFNYCAETTFEGYNVTGERSVQFEVKHDFPAKARLVWYNNRKGYYQYGPFTITVTVNGVKAHEIIQDMQTILEGFFTVPLQNLKKGDVVEFKVNRTETAKWAGDPTFAACLEYISGNLTCNQDPDTPGVYYTTFYDSRSAYVLDEGAKAYTGSISGDQLLLTAIEDNIIPKGEAVIIRCNSATVAITASDSNRQKDADNVLIGSDTDATAPANCYILSYGQNGLGFYRYAEGNALSAHKAYMIFDRPAGSKARAFRMVFADDEVDGIESIYDDSSTSSEQAQNIYSISGLRLNKLQKGINVVNGKKIIVK